MSNSYMVMLKHLSILGGTFGLYLASRQVQLASRQLQEAERQTTLQQSILLRQKLDSMEKEFYRDRGGTAYYKTKDKYDKIQWRTIPRPDELDERNELLDYAGWFSDLGVLVRNGSIRPDDVQGKWGSKVDEVLSNPLVQNNILGNARWDDLVVLGKRLHECTPNGVLPSEDAKRTAEFLRTFDEESKKCRARIAQKKSGEKIVCDFVSRDFEQQGVKF